MSDAEMAVLGAVLAGYRDVDEITDRITGADFADAIHEWIFDAILRVHAGGQQPDPIKVRLALGTDQAGKLPGGPLYLTDLLEACPLPASAPFYAEQVAMDSARRRVSDLAQRLQQLAKSDQNPFEAVNDAKQWLDEFGARSKSDTASIQEAMAEVVDVAEHGQRQGVTSPWPDLDRFTRGFYPGRLYVVGARPGIGKSIMASNSTIHVAKQGLGVFVSSIEMSKLEFAQRCAAAEAKIDIARLEQGKLSDDEWNRLAPVVSKIGDLPIEIADSESQSLAYIRACARRYARKQKLGMVVIDYLQMMEPSSRTASREQQVAEMSRGLKKLARELDVPVLALAQVNRAATSRKDGRPTLSDLRESGGIEADADNVILLHVDEQVPHIVEAIVAKGRSTAKGTANLQIQGHLSRLVGAAWTPHSSLGADTA